MSEDLPAAARQVAVVDCGTTSVRAFLADLAADGGIRVLEDLVQPVDLTAAFSSGTLDRAAMDGVVEALRGIVAAAAGYGIRELRAVGTSGLREADNADVLLERVRAETGVDIEVIDAAEESRLYWQALANLCDRCQRRLDGERLLIEIGGGGACLALIRDGTLVHAVDEHFGTYRVVHMLRSLRDHDDFAVTLDRLAKGAARMMLARLPRVPIGGIVATGSAVRRLHALITGEEPVDIESLPGDRVAAWVAGELARAAGERHAGAGDDRDHADALLAAACLLRHLHAACGPVEVLVPQLTLRDGLIADLLPGSTGPHHLDASHLLAEARQLLARYQGDLAYGENTAELAVQLFDQSRELHGLGVRERTLLQFAALVHDIGAFINVRNRHKHTMHIIESSDIAGLTALEKRMVANIARYHRKSPPEPHHTEFTALPRRERVVVAHLAAILRLAYALDVEREQRIRRLRCRVEDGRFLIRVDRRQIALERWSMSSKAGMFESIFGLQVLVLPMEDA